MKTSLVMSIAAIVLLLGASPAPAKKVLSEQQLDLITAGAVQSPSTRAGMDSPDSVYSSKSGLSSGSGERSPVIMSTPSDGSSGSHQYYNSVSGRENVLDNSTDIYIGSHESYRGIMAISGHGNSYTGGMNMLGVISGRPSDTGGSGALHGSSNPLGSIQSISQHNSVNVR